MTSLAKARQYAYEAFADQDYGLAAKWITRACIDHGFKSHDIANLAFVCFWFCSRSTKANVFDELLAAGLREVDSSFSRYLELSFELDLGGLDSARPVRDRYLDTILRPNILKEPVLPIVFWHIPKCSGTSLNTAIAAHFYAKPLGDVLPGYNFRPLLQFLMRELLGELPYIPSMHFGMDELERGAQHISYTVIRDPVRRCLSMYRQEMASNSRGSNRKTGWHHYRVLPRYGTFWDYRNDTSFENWLNNVPHSLLERQLTTFSARRDVHEAASRLEAVDFVLGRDQLDVGSEQELFEALGLEYMQGGVSTDLNTSDKSIEVSELDIAMLQSRLEMEYRFIANSRRLSG